jgi:inositol-1,4,5-trisphosphate 5-phosphatase
LPGRTHPSCVSHHHLLLLLLHARSHIKSLLRSPEGDGRLSVYSSARLAALQSAIDTSVAEATPDSGPSNVFYFGDFNFRLDQRAVIESLCGSAGLALADSLQSKDETIELPGSAGEALPEIIFGAKSFALRRPQRILDSLADYRAFDVEPAESGLREMPLNFPPTYPRHTRGAAAKAAAASAEWPRYGAKRCPAWTDRVLMSASAWEWVSQAEATAEYGSNPQPCSTVTACDHDPVYLAMSV